jgi:hypothetical protein
MAMEWDYTDGGGGLLEDFPEDPFTCPESFFDASLDSMDMFGGKDLFFNQPPPAAAFPNHHMGTVESLDLESFLNSAIGDSSDGSVLSSEENITATDFYISGDDRTSNTTTSLLPGETQKAFGDECRAVNTVEAGQPAAVIKSERPEDEEGEAITRNLQAVEFDIAKLKQEVDFAYDDDNSMWSDFFSEENPSEISREYDDLLQSLLVTPVNDIDLSLNVFNNVEETEMADSRQAEELQQSILSSIQADHCYTLVSHPDPAYFLTPPPSSDESDRDEESSRDSAGPDLKPTLIKASCVGNLIFILLILCHF